MGKGRQVTIIEGNGFPIAAKKINPNAPCECGSGKKAKKCCGTETKYCYSELNEKQIKEREKELPGPAGIPSEGGENCGQKNDSESSNQ